MSEKVKTNLYLEKLTQDRINELAKVQRRFPGAVVDLVIEEYYAREMGISKQSQPADVSAVPVETN